MTTQAPAPGISPLYVNDTLPNLQITVLDDNGNALNLTGASITMKMQSSTNSSTVKVCTGSWSIDNALAGKMHYLWQQADTNQAGEWLLWITLTFPAGVQHLDPLTLEILPTP